MEFCDNAFDVGTVGYGLRQLEQLGKTGLREMPAWPIGARLLVLDFANRTTPSGAFFTRLFALRRPVFGQALLRRLATHATFSNRSSIIRTARRGGSHAAPGLVVT